MGGSKSFTYLEGGADSPSKNIRMLTTRSPTPVQRRRFAEFEKEVEDRDREFTSGTAIIAKSGLQRGLITAIYWLAPPVYPYRICRSVAEAVDWCKGQLDTVDARVA